MTPQPAPPSSPQLPPSTYGRQREDFAFVRFHDDLVAIARERLATPDGPAAAAFAVQERAEAVLAGYPEPRALVACAPGCRYCCIVNVAVLPPEAAAITAHLLSTRSPEQLTATRLRLADLVAATRDASEDERVALEHPCAFLSEAGSCEIHRVRPLLCRMVTSIDPQACRQALQQQAAGSLMPIVADLFHERLFELAFLALARALDEMGMDSASGRLSEEVLKRLDAPPAMGSA